MALLQFEMSCPMKFIKLLRLLSPALRRRNPPPSSLFCKNKLPPTPKLRLICFKKKKKANTILQGANVPSQSHEFVWRLRYATAPARAGLQTVSRADDKDQLIIFQPSLELSTRKPLIQKKSYSLQQRSGRSAFHDDPSSFFPSSSSSPPSPHTHCRPRSRPCPSPNPRQLRRLHRIIHPAPSRRRRFAWFAAG